ncbi:regulatory protein RecX [Microbulbifer pacificus]|uniref:regulatory protein RecX n=1 Tax=Microbulbifer pacificus TaxID=407164 RepID=UPI001F1A2F3B|nr:regulatory protein RecX [Microbulbifer pacificus]
MSFPQNDSGSPQGGPPESGFSANPASPLDSPEAFQALFSSALDLLSRREHSCQELRQKLGSKYPDGDFDSIFDRVLLRLQELNYQSDKRFAEVFCRSRVQRGQGPLRIRQELQLRGVPSALVQGAMEQIQEEVDWFQLALELLQRKFRRPVDPGVTREEQLKERARRQRYLAYRGFFADAIQFALAELDSGGNREQY